MITEEEVHKALDWLAQNASKAAQAHANRIQMEKARDRIKSLEMKKHDGSAAAQEREALASDAYQTHLQGLREAIELDELYRWRRDLAYAKLDVWRSHSANTRKL
jgi:hypothetical protein